MAGSTLYDVFYRLVRGGQADTIRDCWLDFYRDEKAKSHANTKGPASRQALEWLSRFEELRSWIPQFGGDAAEECLESFDRGLELFGMLDQDEELIEAARTWAAAVRAAGKKVPSADR